jgi:GNAT superfamily N-acetyltransferase
MSGVKARWEIRSAIEKDIPAIGELIRLSVRGLQGSHYSTAQMEAALGSVFGVDRQLIHDRSYFVIEQDQKLIACGGWSKRKTLFGCDDHSGRNDSELDPAIDAARIRAFFVHPDHARRGLGRAILRMCEDAIRSGGFKKIELASTLPGEAFYRSAGFISGKREEVTLPNGLKLGIVHMTKAV